MKHVVATLLMVSAFACYGGENLLKNPGFRSDLAHWQKSGKFTASVKKEEGAKILHVVCDGPVGWPGFSQVLDLPSHDGLYKFSADLRSTGFSDGNGPYLALEFKDAAGKRISVAQSEFIPADGEWHAGALYLQIPKGTAEVKFAMLLHGLGSADFRNPSFVKMDSDEKRLTAPSSAIEIRISDEPKAMPFFGFGAEDNGFAYTKGNRAYGWTEREFALREERIRFLKPSFVRTFVWIGEWMPDGYIVGGDPAALPRWDSDLMQSKYEALALYKELDVPVNITCVEWEMHRFGSLWENREKTLEAYAMLMEHLIKTKGFTNIRYFTLTNEPNTSFASRDGGSFELYGWFCKNLRREFKKRGLDVELVASDDAESFGWFSEFVEDKEVYDTCGLFATHQYLKYPEWNTHIQTEFLKSRTELLDSMPNRKPLVVAEFGFHTEGWSNMDNPYMKEYAYAVQLADYAIEGFNLGVSGYCVWTMHEVYHPPYGRSGNVHHRNSVMEYGLWNYDDDTLRPVYYATSLFTRNTAKGRPIYPCVSSDETIVRATVVGDELFFVNKAVNAAKVKIKGRRSGDGFVFTQDTVDAQQLTDGDRLKKDSSSTFVLPPKSFGRISLK